MKAALGERGKLKIIGKSIEKVPIILHLLLSPPRLTIIVVSDQCGQSANWQNPKRQLQRLYVVVRIAIEGGREGGRED